MKTSDLKDGAVVILTKEIKNLQADRRVTRDWTKEPEFKPGRYIVEESRLSPSEPYTTFFAFTKENDHYRILHEIGPNHPSYAAFVEACVPAEETLRTVLDLAYGDDWLQEILQHFIDAGKITLADVKQAITTVKES